MLATYLNSSNINIAVVAGGNDRAAVEQQLNAVPGLKSKPTDTIAQTVPVAINGQPISVLIQSVTAGGKFNANDVTRQLDGVQGHDIATGNVPNASVFKIVPGAQDAHAGRNLRAGDAATTNAILSLQASHAPLNLKLGDTVTIADAVTHNQTTITVVGFYQYTLNFEPIQMDGGAVTALTGGHPSYLFTAYVDPTMADRTLARIQAAVPAAQTFSVADTFAQVTSYLNNLVIVLVTIASLAMLAAVIIIANAVALAMIERRRELGILKAVGYTSRDVLGEVLVENGMIGFTGGVLAMVLVAVTTGLLGSLLFNTSFVTPVLTVLEIVPAATLICMLVAALVAWRATRVRPLEVLRYE
jgi:ABC-type antimicrobial peptide transport system permease subunit